MGEILRSFCEAAMKGDLSGGWIYNRVARKGVLVSGKSGSTPMKDTEALYNDFDWEITGR